MMSPDTLAFIVWSGIIVLAVGLAVWDVLKAGAEWAAEVSFQPTTCKREFGHDGPCSGYPRIVGQLESGEFVTCHTGVVAAGQSTR